MCRRELCRASPSLTFAIDRMVVSYFPEDLARYHCVSSGFRFILQLLYTVCVVTRFGNFSQCLQGFLVIESSDFKSCMAAISSHRHAPTVAHAVNAQQALNRNQLLGSHSRCHRLLMSRCAPAEVRRRFQCPLGFRSALLPCQGRQHSNLHVRDRGRPQCHVCSRICSPCELSVLAS